jgi:hypothetical protein
MAIFPETVIMIFRYPEIVAKAVNLNNTERRQCARCSRRGLITQRDENRSGLREPSADSARATIADDEPRAAHRTPISG